MGFSAGGTVTMSVVYNVGGADSKGSSTAGNLAEIMRDERFPNGASVYTTLTGVTLMVFYVFAMQCVSTLAITRRETNSWSWTFFQWFYMTGLAWVIAFFCHQTGRWMGLG